MFEQFVEGDLAVRDGPLGFSLLGDRGYFVPGHFRRNEFNGAVECMPVAFAFGPV